MNLENKLAKSQTAFENWKTVPFTEKQKLLQKLASLLEKDAEKFGKIITQEMNKPITQSISEVQKCALMTRYYAEAENILKPEKIKTEFRVSEIHSVPKGVILGVMPWNFPFWQALRFAVPAILAGNTIGGHMNIMPTILELIAPKDFTYYSLFYFRKISRN